MQVAAATPTLPALTRQFDVTTSAVRRAQYVAAERVVNGLRIGVIGVLSIAAAIYSPFLTPQLMWANVLVLAPMLLWAVGQHFFFHAKGRYSESLPQINAFVDVSAVSAAMVSYAAFGEPAAALRSPILALYLVILATKPFTVSPRIVLYTTAVAVVQYASVVVWMVSQGAIVVDPRVEGFVGPGGLLDELSRLMFVVIGGLVSTYAASWNDRTLRQAVGARRDSEARFQAVFAHSAVGVALLQKDGTIVEANEAMSALLGEPGIILNGRRPHDFSPADDAERAEQMLRSVVDTQEDAFSEEFRFVRRDGTTVWGAVAVSHARQTRDVQLIMMVTDVTERKTLEARLLHQAFYDSLTGLANRSLFRDRVEHALARTQRERSEVGVLFLDLDNFKSVNDTLGHAAGDSLLKVVSSRLLSATRGCDTVARLGGDEFAVILERVRNEADAVVVAERITASLRAPIELDSGNFVHVTSSIGIARADAAETVDELLRNADVAMYAAKAESPGQFKFYEPSMHSALVDRVMIESDMRRGLDEREFWVAYQPIVDLDTRELRGMEALARWRHPVRGSIEPSSFIPVAEETGLIQEIGRLVLDDACRHAATWNEARGDREPLSITVNLSTRQLQSGDLLTDVATALAQSGLEPSLLVLEMTESVLMAHGELSRKRLNDLKALGVRLAIDDFGTGYSSLAYLQEFPVDVLKIDRTFTSNLDGGANNNALARTIIALGDLLALRTIAEGVEVGSQHDRLRDLGCDYGQGFFFGHPVSAREMDAIVVAARLACPVEGDEQALQVDVQAL